MKRTEFGGLSPIVSGGAKVRRPGIVGGLIYVALLGGDEASDDGVVPPLVLRARQMGLDV